MSVGSPKIFSSSFSGSFGSGSSSGSEVGTCSIAWDTSIYSGTLGGNPWVVSLGGSRIRYNIEDSDNGDCGGANGNTQDGVATATIIAGPTGSSLGFDFSGIAEEQDTNFENIEFWLNGILVASATSPGSLHDDTCAMGPAVVTYHVAPPYVLPALSVNTLEITFTTGDGLWHYGAYYEANFYCTPL